MLEVFTTIIGSLMGLSFLSQAWRIVKLKKAEEISLFTVSFILFGASVWLLYGIRIEDKVIIIANSCGILGSGITLIVALYYRNKNK